MLEGQKFIRSHAQEPKIVFHYLLSLFVCLLLLIFLLPTWREFSSPCYYPQKKITCCTWAINYFRASLFLPLVDLFTSFLNHSKEGDFIRGGEWV